MTLISHCGECRDRLAQRGQICPINCGMDLMQRTNVRRHECSVCIPITKAGKIHDAPTLSCLAIRLGRKWQTKTKGAKPVNGDPTHVVRRRSRRRRADSDESDSGRPAATAPTSPSHIDIAVVQFSRRSFVEFRVKVVSNGHSFASCHNRQTCLWLLGSLIYPRNLGTVAPAN